MKAFITTDLQLHAWQHASIGPDGVNERVMDVIHSLRQLRELAKEKKIGYLFIKGDIFEERGKLDVVVLNSFYRELFAFRKAGIRVIMLVGNHDWVPVGDFHSLEVFQDLVTVVSKPTRFNFDGTRVLAIPFMPEPRKVVKYLRKFGKQADLILLHTSVLNVRLNSGAKWTEGIPLKAIPKKPWTLIGHDHTFKKLRKRVYHLGSLLHVDKGDTGKKKYFAEYNEGKVIFHPSQGPEFKEFTLDIWNGKLSKKIRKKMRGHFISITFAGDTNVIGEIKQYVLNKAKARSCDISISKHEVDASAPSFKETASIRLNKALKRCMKDLPESEQKPTFRLGLEVLAEAAHG